MFIFLFDSFRYLGLLLFWIKSQSVVAYKSVDYKNACFIKKAILTEKFCQKKGGLGKNIKRGMAIKRGWFKPTEDYNQKAILI